jgi:hypothetical protein
VFSITMPENGKGILTIVLAALGKIIPICGMGGSEKLTYLSDSNNL